MCSENILQRYVFCNIKSPGYVCSEIESCYVHRTRIILNPFAAEKACACIYFDREHINMHNTAIIIVQ